MTEIDQPIKNHGTVGRILAARGRAGRGMYLIGVAAVIVCVALAFGALASAMNPTGSGGAPLLAVPLLLIALWLHICIATARLRDAHLSPWWSLVLIVAPFAMAGLLAEFLEVSIPARVALVAGLLICYAGPALLPHRDAP